MDEKELREKMCEKNGYWDTGGLEHCDYGFFNFNFNYFLH